MSFRRYLFWWTLIFATGGHVGFALGYYIYKPEPATHARLDCRVIEGSPNIRFTCSEVP
jgi:hypothetical protein